jgi:hypothetical protein
MACSVSLSTIQACSICSQQGKIAHSAVSQCLSTWRDLRTPHTFDNHTSTAGAMSKLHLMPAGKGDAREGWV